MHGSPNIVLMQGYSLRKDYGKYLNYMVRKKAIKGQEYLDEKSKIELNIINNTLSDSGYFKTVEVDPELKANTSVEKKAKALTQEKTFFNADNDDYGKYIGYMIRINALAKNKTLTAKEKAEKTRLTKKVAEMKQVEDKPELNSADDTLIGFYSSESKTLKLKDAEHARSMLRQGRDNGSVLWEPVVSFDNDFLIREGILNPKTGELHDNILKDASYKMMQVATDKEHLNHPYWSASIHRNTDNIHIHFALVEKANSREIITYNGMQEPKAKFKMSTVYAMKSAFSNELIDISKTQARIIKNRDKLREVVVDNAKEQLQNPSFQKEVNRLMTMLPPNHRQWQYGTLHKINPKITDQVDKITDYLLKDDPNYHEWSDLVTDIDEMYKGQYGKSKNAHKQYAINQFRDLQKRTGNRLLTDLKEIDMKASLLKIKSNTPKDKQIKKSDNYIMECLEILEQAESKKQTKPQISTKQPNNFSSIKSENKSAKEFQKRQAKFKRKLQSRKIDQKLRQMMRPIISKKNTAKLENSVEQEFENGLTSFDKVRAIEEFNRWHDIQR